MSKIKIGIIGLGYVGLPLARLFATKYSVIGYDINQNRILEINSGLDVTNEVDESVLRSVLHCGDESENGLIVTTELMELSECNHYIITVPTPIDSVKKPDLNPLINSSLVVGKILKIGDIVIYESTVYPGLTEEICIPKLEEASGLKFNRDFYVGYSPERINPGDKERTVEKILKITSGSTPEIALQINELYSSVIEAGTYMAPSIKVAEAAKIIENAQRDINIAFVNELSKIFQLIGIDTSEVLKAAGTKWNFLSFKPGLVGGHCIGVDPYYLTQKAEQYGYHPEIILAGRRINDGMGEYVAQSIIKLMIKKGISIRNSDVLILGFTFKENCPDIRNTRVIDLVKSLKEFGVSVSVFDPLVNREDVVNEYKLEVLAEILPIKYDAVILAVNHQEFMNLCWEDYLKTPHVFADVKSALPNSISDFRL